MLQIESKARALSSGGAQSQYRAFATIGVKLKDAVEAIDEFMLARFSPEEEGFKELNAVKATIQEASDETEERIGLIFKADAVPKHGWKALTIYEEKKRLSGDKENDKEAEKAFAACVKQAQDETKKSKPSTSTSSSRPFRARPGGRSGFSSTGDVVVHKGGTIPVDFRSMPVNHLHYFPFFFHLCCVRCQNQNKAS